MKVLVLGGQLQGTEITYLAQQAGWEVTVADRNETALASKLCDHFVCTDIKEAGPELFKGHDLVFPALEDLETLHCAKRLTAEAKVPFVFDEQAYVLSRSKIQTNDFLKGIGVDIPPLLEDLSTADDNKGSCYIVKPDCSSGSKGLRCFIEAGAARDFIEQHQGESLFGQAFYEGPIYSIEVVCDNGVATQYLITEVVVDAEYDCHRIVAPADIPAKLKEQIKDISLRIGQALQMKGIFDIELVLHGSVPYVLEIDARMPSQTPIAVYYACGVNLVVETARSFLAPLMLQAEVDESPGIDLDDSACSYVILQHVCVKGNTLQDIHLIGEGQLKGAPPFIKQDGFCGTDSALVSTDTQLGYTYATLIAKDVSHDLVADKMNRIIKQLAGMEAIGD